MTASAPLTSSGHSAVFLVARREVVTRIRSRAFRIGTVLLVALVVVGVAVASVLAHQDKPVRIAFAGPAQALASSVEATAAALGAKVTVSEITDQAQAESDIRTGRLDVLVSGSATSPTALVETQLDPTIEAALDTAVRQAVLAATVSQAGLDPATVTAEVTAGKARVQILKPPNPDQNQSIVLGVVVAYFLMYTIAAYGGFVASGVVEEKSTRIVEIILSTIRPRQLLAGKVLGIGLVGLLQVTVVGATALLMIHLTRTFSIPAASPGAIAFDVAWYLLGYYFYATLFATGGALVSRQEDVQTVVFFPVVFLIAALLLAFSVVANPTRFSTIALSLLPPFAPILIPVRTAVSDVVAWQILLAIGLLLVSAIGLTALAGRIYANSVLRIGRRVALRDALRAK